MQELAQVVDPVSGIIPRGLVLFSLALVLMAGSANADIDVYHAPTPPGNNYIPFGPDGTSSPPPFSVWGLGDTITFSGTVINLDTASLQAWNGTSSSDVFTLNLYAGSDPNTGALLGSSTATVPASNTTNTTATFSFGGLPLPNTVTFIVSAPLPGNGYYPSAVGLINSLGAPTVGSAVDSLWYGNGPGTFVANDTWAIANGDTNFIAAEFNATPEPSLYAVLGLGLAGLLLLRRRMHESAASSSGLSAPPK
jgi:hypothetical protein